MDFLGALLTASFGVSVIAYSYGSAMQGSLLLRALLVPVLAQLATTASTTDAKPTRNVQSQQNLTVNASLDLPNAPLE